MENRIVVGVTGASGTLYAYTLVRALTSMGWIVEGIITPMGEKVLSFENGVDLTDVGALFHRHLIDNLFSPLASGSFSTKGMIVIPCSMNTLGLIANGVGDNLLVRAAQVTLKERRPLVVVPREMPYNIIQLENMLRLARAGGTVLPASPGFYHRPQSIADLVNHVVGRILEQFGIKHDLYQRWEGL
ncbi:MAG: UbiX family flavin prenyltransferase [Desulfitobacteriaceae bacterium]